MRFLRLLLIACLAIILIALALANRDTVTLHAFPANFGQYLGGQWTIELPLFLVIFLAMALGMLIGLVWEYLREAHLRREARRSNAEIARLEGEVGTLRQRHANPRDEVLAILDHPPARASAGASGNAATSLPAPR